MRHCSVMVVCMSMFLLVALCGSLFSASRFCLLLLLSFVVFSITFYIRFCFSRICLSLFLYVDVFACRGFWMSMFLCVTAFERLGFCISLYFELRFWYVARFLCVAVYASCFWVGWFVCCSFVIAILVCRGFACRSFCASRCLSVAVFRLSLFFASLFL